MEYHILFKDTSEDRHARNIIISNLDAIPHMNRIGIVLCITPQETINYLADRAKHIPFPDNQSCIESTNVIPIHQTYSHPKPSNIFTKVLRLLIP